MLTCLRCGAPLDPDDTVCFTCGAPVGENKTPTQPVPLPKAVKERTAALPALKPTSNAGEPVGAGTRTPSLSRPLPPVSAPFVPLSPTSRRKANRGRWLLGLLAALLIAAVAVTGGIVLRASLAGPPVPRTVLYQDPAGHFQVQQPALWVARAQPDGVLFADSVDANAITSTIQVNITPEQPKTTAASQADALATSLGLAGPSSTTDTIAGQTWEQREGTVVGSDGASREVLIEATLANGEVYTITCESPLANFGGTNSLVFQPFLASFTLS